MRPGPSLGFLGGVMSRLCLWPLFCGLVYQTSPFHTGLAASRMLCLILRVALLGFPRHAGLSYAARPPARPPACLSCGWVRSADSWCGVPASRSWASSRRSAFRRRPCCWSTTARRSGPRWQTCARRGARRRDRAGVCVYAREPLSPAPAGVAGRCCLLFEGPGGRTSPADLAIAAEMHRNSLRAVS